MLFFLLSSGVSAGTIAGSFHDFRGYSWDVSGEICKSCHTPHQTKTLPLPLWEPESPSDTYALYPFVQLPDTDAKESFVPNGSSKICLSCHDGTVAIENFGDITDKTLCLQGQVSLGMDLYTNHPVSFVYDSSLCEREGELYDPSIRLSGVLGSTGTIKEDLLFQGRMECSSCHDVHNTRAVPGTKLLLKGNAGSALCLTCHNK